MATRKRRALRPKAFRRWLKAKTASDSRTYFLGAVASALGGALILAFLYWVTFKFLYVALHPEFPISPIILALVAGAAIGSLFLFNMLVSRQTMEELSVTPGMGREVHRIRMRYRFGMGIGLAGLAFVLMDPRTTLSMVSSIVFIGPRMLTLGVELFARSQLVRRLDHDMLAPVLALLFAEDEKVSLEAIQDEFPNIDFSNLLEECDVLGGVVFLPSPPMGLSLSTDFKNDFQAWRTREKEKRSAASE